MGVDRMSPYLAQFNLGKQTGIDINHEYAGVLPTRAYALRAYVDITNGDLKRFNKFRADYRSYDKVRVARGSGHALDMIGKMNSVFVSNP